MYSYDISYVGVSAHGDESCHVGYHMSYEYIIRYVRVYSYDISYEYFHAYTLYVCVSDISYDMYVCIHMIYHM